MLRDLARILVFFLLVAAGGLSWILTAYNLDPVLLQFGFFELDRIPVGFAVAMAFWAGFCFAVILGWPRLVAARLRARRLVRALREARRVAAMRASAASGAEHTRAPSSGRGSEVHEAPAEARLDASQPPGTESSP